MTFDDRECNLIINALLREREEVPHDETAEIDALIIRLRETLARRRERAWRAEHPEPIR